MIDWLNRLAKWRTLYAGWQLGTRTDTDPEALALKDHRESTLIQRVELSALAGLLIEKGIMTREEYGARLNHEAMVLEGALQKRFPGIKATDQGLTMSLPEAAETMARYHFKP